VTTLVPAPVAPDPALRPRARGWIHFWSAGVAIAMGITLTVLAATEVGGHAPLLCGTYALTIIGLFTISATYHRHVWVSATARLWMKRADHSMIFVFIAGTYTPLVGLGMPPSFRGPVLWIVWLGALGGVVLKMLFPHAPRWLGVPFYLALGFVVVFVIPELLRSVGVTAFVLIAAGGLFYTAGALCYATRRPNPWPRTFGYHEFFHAAVSLAAACHCVAVWLVLFG
jgi:hemolysin III